MNMLMKTRNLFVCMAAFLVALVACQQEDFGAASLEVDATSITLPLDGGSESFTIKTTRDWTVAVEAVGNSSVDGITVSPSHGNPSHDAQTITVTAAKNTGRNRKAVIVIKASTESKEIAFSQNGELGNQMNVDEVMSSETGTALTIKNALVYGVNKRGFVIGDDTGLILVYDGTEKIVEGVEVGDKIDIDGTVGSYGIPQVIPTQIKVVSEGNDVPQLEPSVLTKDNMATADRSMVNYVEMEGIYVKSGDYHNIKIIGSNLQGSISYPLESLSLAEMEGEVIKIRGYYSGGTSEYYYNVLVTEVLEHKPLDADAKTVAEIHQAAADALLKAHGTVMGVHERGFVLSDGTGVIYVYTGSAPEAQVGNTVTVVGLKSVNYGVHQIVPLKTTVEGTVTVSYPAPVDLTTLSLLNAYSIDAARVAPDYVKVKGILDGLNITYEAEDGVSQNKMPLMNYTLENYDFLNGKEVAVSGYVVSYNSTKTPPTVGILVVDVESDPYLYVNKNAVSVLPSATSAEFNVKSNVAWTATADVEWLTVSPASGSGNGVVSLSFSEYTATDADRTATITVTAEGQEPVTVEFLQMKAVEGGVLTECVFTGWEFNVEGWSTTYEKHVVDFDVLTVTFEAANKQNEKEAVSDCPVTKGQPIIVKMKDGRTMSSLTMYLKQWNTKAQTATLYASTDGGETFAAESSAESSDFTLATSSLPDGTNAVKVTFSSADNQVGLSKILVVYKDAQ